MVEKEWGAFLDFLVQFKDHPSKSDLKKTGTPSIKPRHSLESLGDQVLRWNSGINIHPSPEVKLMIMFLLAVSETFINVCKRL